MNIAIIGGSITEGTGSTTYKNSYVYKLEQYFKEKNKNSIIKNLGSAGTASQFGLFRLKRDIEEFKPDLIFIEFGVNDRIYSSYECSIYFEGLIRECAKLSEKIIIIDFPTGMGDSCTSIHKKLAYYYGIPLIDVQDEVWRRIGNRDFTWLKISIDNLHPNDKGHELYYEIIKKSLDNINIEDIEIKTDNRVLMKYRLKNPIIESYEKAEFYGEWKEESFKLRNKFDKAAITETIGEALVFKFKGQYLSMMNLLTNDSGMLECELDNFTFNIDLYNDSYGYYETTINLRDLEDKEHTLIMKVSNKKNNKSLGNKVIIGGFLIDSI